MKSIKKESIKIVFYQENGKTKVRLKNKTNKKASDEVKNLHLLINSKIRDFLKKV